MRKTINLGYVHMDSFDKDQDIWPEWMVDDDDGDYTKEINRNPPDAIVLQPNLEFTVVIDYPVTKTCDCPLKTGKRGLTRKQLVLKITKMYKKMYDKEGEAGLKGKELPYGIWGHCLGDLMLHTARVRPSGRIDLGVDS